MRNTADNHEPEEVNARKEDDSVILLPADEFRLPNVLQLIESGKRVLIIPVQSDSE